ncbi:cache domain-containing protein [Paracoccus methylarcula]|uniref:histidine kinase n=1 Tax=Paracoccus methylarcula TaxID=72022 RepID=A0A422QYT0_9RHOB|nr:cache domain-containing protein [Paracoccus methylarcula]RNF35112.1 PAS domain S-box protein [Paracoccus methylarcula]
MKNSLGALLAIGLAGLQLVAVLAVVFTSYVTSERAMLNHARNILSDVGVNTTEHSKGFLRPARGAAELAARLSENRILASDDPKTLERFLFQQLKVTPQFSSLYFGSEDGSFVFVMRDPGPIPFRTKIITMDGDTRRSEQIWRDANFREIKSEVDPTDNFDPRTRPWYTRARDTLDTIWTDPYIFFTAQQPGITLAAPVRKDGAQGIRGVVGVDIEISSISEFLSNLRIGNTGKALIINRNGDVIAHPNPELLKTRDDDGNLRFQNIREFEDKVAREAFSWLGDGFDPPTHNEAFSKFTFDDEVYISTLTPVISGNLPWTIAVYAPEIDFIGGLKQSRAMSIWIAVCVAIATGIAGLALANYIYRPVRAFAVRSALVAQGEIDPSDPLPSTYRELAHANETLMQQIVARKKAEREYGQTFDLSSRAMAQTAPETGKLLKVNAKFCEITGYDTNDIKDMRYVDLIHPDDRTLFNSDFFAAGDGFATRHEVRFIRKNGESIDVAVNAILIRDHNGAPLHAVVTLDDITESKAQENQIARLNRDLIHLSRGHTLGQMAAGLAHELNQPLAAIAQNTDTALLIVDSLSDSPPELREVLTEVEEQSLRAGDIIRALRGFIMKDAASATSFDIVELIKQARRLVQPEATEAGVAINARMGALPMVSANRIQVAQVIVNLLRNAVEAIGESDLVRREINVAAQQVDSRLEISVEDTGPGIDHKIELFTEFETTKANGMGLGLSICRTMIEANSGKLWHDATYTRGARFCFTLPIHQDSSGGEAEPGKRN